MFLILFYGCLLCVATRIQPYDCCTDLYLPCIPIYRLDVQRRDLRDLKGRGPWAVASERTSNLTCLDLRAVNSLDDEI